MATFQMEGALILRLNLSAGLEGSAEKLATDCQPRGLATRRVRVLLRPVVALRDR